MRQFVLCWILEIKFVHLMFNCHKLFTDIFLLKVFTLVFTFECIMKVMALSKEFFECGWNMFDLIIVTASILDLIFELVDGLSVLRGLRLVRN